ncbi:MAG: DUF2339 domain-containing protein, partial [Acidobacteriota bacterium]
LLSTGEDRPVALFAYLLVATTGVHLVALRMRFRLAPWLAIAGAVVLFGGWYEKFFDLKAPLPDPVTGELLASTAGAYWALAPRLAPLGFAIAFAAFWVGLAFAARRRNWALVGPTALLLAGLLAAHAGCGALLLDRPGLLAAAMVACGVAAAALLRREEEPALLGLPLLASFAILAWRSELAHQRPLLAVALGGLWLLVYGAALVRRAARALAGEQQRRTFIVLTIAGVLAVALASLLLGERPPQALAASVLVLSLGALGLSLWQAPFWLGAAVGGAAVLALLNAAPEVKEGSGVFLALVGLWAATYLAAAGRELLRRAPSPLLVLTAAGGPLAFVATVFLSTPQDQAGLRALCVAAAGLAVFALGAALLRRQPGERDASTVLLGEGVALLALAAGVAFSGVTITLVWAVMAAVVAHLAARRDDQRWLLGAAALFGVALLRLLTIDIAVASNELGQFWATTGREGALHLTPLANPRAAALAGLALALLAAARAAAQRKAESSWRTAAASFATLAHALLLGLVVSEVRLLVTVYPALPIGGLPEDEFQAFMAKVGQALEAQRNRLAVSTTLAMGGYGGLLLALGFALRSVLHRWLGLIVLGATLAKLALWDIWKLPRLLQVVVLVGVGALLLGAGFLYARFGRRILGFLRDGAAALLLGLAAAPAEAVDVRRFSHRAELAVEQPGLVAVPVEPELYRASRQGPALAGLRIVAPGGGEAPWFLRDVAPAQPAADVPIEMLDPVVAPEGSTRATFDVGHAGTRHSELELRLEGKDFLRHCRIEVSDDRAGWALLATRLVYRATGEGEKVSERTTLRYPVSASRYLRLTIEGVAGQAPVPILGASMRLREAGAEPTGEVPLAIVRRQEDSEQHRSVLVLDAGGKGVPIRALIVSCADSRFERRVKLEATNREETWLDVAHGVLFRAGDDEGLRLSAGSAKRFFRLTISNGDDPPLRITEAAGEFRRQEIIVEARTAGVHRFYLGRDKIEAPAYDLAAAFGKLAAPAVRRATLGHLVANPELAPVPADEGRRPWSERARLPIGVALGLLTFLLAWWALRLLRRTPRGE